MARKRTFFLTGMLLGLALLVALTASAKNVVIPTQYGYGVVSHYGGWVYPYVVHPAYGGYYTPYYGAYNHYYLSGYYPYGYAGTPYWTGSQWVYGSGGYAAADRPLNLRSSPSKSRNAIGSLDAGEPVWIYGRYGNWCLVQSMSNPYKRGYAYAAYLRGNAWPGSWNGWMNAYVPRGW